MTIYETIKAAVTARQVAEHYGLKAGRNGMACCPFHNDRNPSLKLNEEYFYCFGCGAKGDVIDFVARLFDLSNYEAAQRLAADFGISTEPGQAVAVPHKTKRPHILQFREDEMLCFRVLTDYLHLLEDWEVRYLSLIHISCSKPSSIVNFKNCSKSHSCIGLLVLKSTNPKALLNSTHLTASPT